MNVLHSSTALAKIYYPFSPKKNAAFQANSGRNLRIVCNYLWSYPVSQLVHFLGNLSSYVETLVQLACETFFFVKCSVTKFI